MVFMFSLHLHESHHCSHATAQVHDSGIQKWTFSAKNGVTFTVVNEKEWNRNNTS